MNETNCSRCGKAVAGAEVYFSTVGLPQCIGCNQLQDLEDSIVAVGNKIVGAAWSALSLAFLSWIVNPFFLFTVSALGSAVYALRALETDDVFSQQVGKKRMRVRVVAAIAVVVTICRFAIPILFGVLAELNH